MRELSTTVAFPVKAGGFLCCVGRRALRRFALCVVALLPMLTLNQVEAQMISAGPFTTTTSPAVPCTGVCLDCSTQPAFGAVGNPAILKSRSRVNDAGQNNECLIQLTAVGTVVIGAQQTCVKIDSTLIGSLIVTDINNATTDGAFVFARVLVDRGAGLVPVIVHGFNQTIVGFQSVNDPKSSFECLTPGMHDVRIELGTLATLTNVFFDGDTDVNESNFKTPGDLEVEFTDAGPCGGGANQIIQPIFQSGLTPGEKGVINAAIDWWSAALPDPGLLANKVVVTFNRAALGPNVLGGTVPTASTDPANDMPGGVAGTLFAGRPQSATMTINSQQNFFVDTSPHGEEEFFPLATADPNPFDDGNVFFFKNFAAVAPAAVGRTDLLTVVKHELGHALGWDGDYQNFRANMTAIFGGNDLNNNFFSGILGANLLLEGDGQPGSVNESVCINNINELSHVQRMMFASSLMSPSVPRSTRRLQSQVSIAPLGDAYGYAVNLNPSHDAVTVPTLSTRAMLILTILLMVAWLWLVRRKRAGI